MKSTIFFQIFFITIAILISISTRYLLINNIHFTNSCTDCNSILGKINVADAYRSNSISISLEGADRSTYLDTDKNFVL